MAFIYVEQFMKQLISDYSCVVCCCVGSWVLQFLLLKSAIFRWCRLFFMIFNWIPQQFHVFNTLCACVWLILWQTTYVNVLHITWLVGPGNKFTKSFRSRDRIMIGVKSNFMFSHTIHFIDEIGIYVWILTFYANGLKWQQKKNIHSNILRKWKKAFAS